MVGLILALACLAATTVAFPNDLNTCPGGHAEGAQVDIGQYYYECRAGQLVPIGCLTPKGRIALHQTYDLSSQIRAHCIIDSYGYPAIWHKSCLDSSGVEHQGNERWTESSIVYECKRDGVFLSVEGVGCNTASGQIDVGGKVPVGDLVYACSRDRNYYPVFKPWGCFGKDGRQYATGDQYDYNDVWYYCMEKNGVITNDAVGCVHRGQRYHDGQRHSENDILFSCNVQENRATWNVSGCVTKHWVHGQRMERRLGCSWQEGEEPFEVQYHCVPDEAKKTAVKTAEHCLYVLDRGTFKIEIGCYRVIDKVGMACQKFSNDAGDVRLVSWPVGENGYLVNPPPDMRNC